MSMKQSGRRKAKSTYHFSFTFTHFLSLLSRIIIFFLLLSIIPLLTLRIHMCQKKNEASNAKSNFGSKKTCKNRRKSHTGNAVRTKKMYSSKRGEGGGEVQQSARQYKAEMRGKSGKPDTSNRPSR
ncbi:hypothetical protein K457DRAFT_558464 [Linnemannia elongata AG-77]|uniref:Uncharacterized protein n=1 Tax=Linnemannia elongata AG-77 TaxID=1314771 RepID=A0A197JU92_9FUNG|nr:hypothetical protein K457DRAFT_558464 [Linnemannia elongata AG-77]